MESPSAYKNSILKKGKTNGATALLLGQLVDEPLYVSPVSLEGVPVYKN
jgi:hypothetical protein